MLIKDFNEATTMIPSCATLIIPKSVHFVYRQTPFPLDNDVFIASHFQKTSLNIPNTMQGCSYFRDTNKIKWPLICTVRYLIETPALDMWTCLAAACWRRMVTCCRYASSEFPALASTGYQHELIVVQRSRWRKLFCVPLCRNYSSLDVACCKLPKF